MNNFIVVPAPGHYGDRATVISSHRTQAAALRAIRGFPGLCVRESPGAKKGDAWFRANEATSPMVRR